MYFKELNISSLFGEMPDQITGHSHDMTVNVLQQQTIAIMINGSGKISYPPYPAAELPIADCTEELLLEEGDVLFIPKYYPYKSEWSISKKSGRVTFLYIRFDFYEPPRRFLLNRHCLQKVSVRDKERLFAAMENIMNLSHMKQEEWSKEETAYFAAENMYAAIGIVAPKLTLKEAENIETEREKARKKILPALELLKKTPEENFPVSALAKACFLSESRFFSLFKNATETTPIVYKNTLLLTRAANFLQRFPDVSVEETAYRFGFCSTEYFIRQFKKHFGVSPDKYRKSARYFDI